MQPLRKEAVLPQAFLRQAAADFLNGGMAEGFDFQVELPEEPLPPLYADPFLLRRAVNNLLTNSVKYSSPGASIRLGAEADEKFLSIWVEGGTLRDGSGPLGPGSLEPDGGAAHGTGLKLVSQIAAAHGGTVDFSLGSPCRCRLRLPVRGSFGEARRPC